MKFKVFCKKVENHLFNDIRRMGFFDNMSDEAYIQMCWRRRIQYPLDLGNPKAFNEKLQWLKINDHNPAYTQMVDKYEAKLYVADKIGEEYIIPTLGVWEQFEDIDFDMLPNRFVMKCTHDSGGVVIVNDKKNLDWQKAKKRINRGLKRNYYMSSREWPYKNVKPRIIIEENLQDSDDLIQINDYKLMCFNGKVKCSFVCSNRNSKEGLCVNFYDREWNPMPFERHYRRNPVEIEKPSQYENMVVLAEKLSQGIPFVRVDFYQVNEHIFFGELTFYPGSGMEEFTPVSWDFTLGSWLTLPNQ